MHPADIMFFVFSKNDKQRERGYHINKIIFLEGIILSEVMGR